MTRPAFALNVLLASLLLSGAASAAGYQFKVNIQGMPPAVWPSCTTPWAASLAHNGKVFAYSAASVPFGGSCETVKEERSCHKGTLAGSFTHATCSETSELSCTFNGATVTSAAPVVAYSTSTVPLGSSCSSVQELRSCTNGVLSGTYAHSTCEAVACTPGTQAYATAGDATFIMPPGCTTLTAKVWGAGGGSLWSGGTLQYYGGGGGYASATSTTTNRAPVTVVVGGGGGGAGGGGASAVLLAETVLAVGGGGGGVYYYTYHDGSNVRIGGNGFGGGTNNGLTTTREGATGGDTSYPASATGGLSSFGAGGGSRYTFSGGAYRNYSGGGGGGYLGGTVRNNDYQGHGGSNYALNGTMGAGSTYWPASTNDTSYLAPAGNGGANGSGSPGRVVLTWQ